MGCNERSGLDGLGKSDQGFTSVNTTRVLNIPTGTPTEYLITSGNWAMQVFNVGASTIAWGDSNITASTGGILFYSMSEIFRPVKDSFGIYFLADSVQGTIAVNEFN